MANSSLILTFNQDLDLDAKLGFTIITEWPFGVPSSVPAVYTWVNFRSASYEVSMGAPTATVGERSANNFASAFELDFPEASVTRNQNVVTIVFIPAAGGKVSFYSPVSSWDFFTNTLITIDNDPGVEIQINNESATSVFPVSIDFVHQQNQPKTPKLITITGTDWRIVAKPNFVLSSVSPNVVITTVTDSSGTYDVATGSGLGYVVVDLGDYYDSDVVFSSSDLNGTFEIFDNDVLFGTVAFSVSVIRLSEFLQNPFVSGKLYFSQELNYLRFSSQVPNTYIAFSIAIKVFKISTYEPIVYTRTYNFPLFQGKGDFHIGSIVHTLFEELQEIDEFVPTFKNNYYKTQYRPAEISVSLEEKAFNGNPIGLTVGALPMFKMAKGYRPFMTDNQLALLTVAQQEETRITPNSFVATSFVFIGTPRVVVKKNNQIIDDFEVPAAQDKVIYSYFRFNNDVKPGDSLELIVVNGLETRSQRYLVFPNGLESTYFLFENNNQMLEPFEFSGRRRVNQSFKHNTSPKFKDLYAFEDKVSTEITQSFIVNTGQLTKSDFLLVSALVASPKVWCSFNNPDGPYYRVAATTSKLNTQDTSSSDESFDVEFNLLENANASIYPR